MKSPGYVQCLIIYAVLIPVHFASANCFGHLVLTISYTHGPPISRFAIVFTFQIASPGAHFLAQYALPWAIEPCLVGDKQLFVVRFWPIING